MSEEAESWIPKGPKFFVVGKEFYVTQDPTEAWKDWAASRGKQRLAVYCIIEDREVTHVDSIDKTDDKIMTGQFHQDFILEAHSYQLEEQIAVVKAKIAELQLQTQ